MDDVFGAGVFSMPEDTSAMMALSLPPDLPIASILSTIQANATTSLPPALTEAALSSPNEELIIAIYSALAALSAKDEDELQSREARDVEIESQLNAAQRIRGEAEQQIAIANRERDAAHLEKTQAQAGLAERETELATIKANLESGSSASAEVKAVLDKEQREKKELLEVLDRERSESSRKSDEIETLTTRVREARQEVNKVTTELQERKASEASAKFKVQSLTQELELARNDASWAHSELSRVNGEQTAFRSSKHAEVVRLQSELDSVNQSLATLQQKADALQTAFDDASKRLTEASVERESLLNRLATQEESFRREIETKDRLAGLLERRADDSARRTQQIEDAWENVLSEQRDREEELGAQAEAERRRGDALEQEKEELKLALDKLAESVGIETDRVASAEGRAMTPSTPLRPFGGNVGLGNIFSSMMSPTAAMASSLQRSGKTFTEVYTALARTEEELRREKLESKRLGSILQSVMADIEERGPTLQAQRDEVQRLSMALEELSAEFARSCEERDIADRESKHTRAESSALKRENGLLSQQLADLGRQVRGLTREIIIRDDPSAASRLQDDDDSDFPMANGENGLDESDTQAVITTQLVTFDSLSSLVAQNGRLLRVARDLGARMEEEEAKWKDRNTQEESEAIREAASMIERLEREISSERTKLEAVRRERDMFRSMMANGSRAGFAGVPAAAEGSTSAPPGAANAALANQYATLQSQFDSFREETAQDADALKQEARQARDDAGKSALTAAREKAGREASEERYRTIQQSFDLQRTELSELRKRLQSQQEQLARLETSSHTLSEELLSSRKELDRLRNESSNLRAERDIAKNAEARLLEEAHAMVKEKAALNELLRNVQSLQNDLDRSASEAKRGLEGQIEKLEEQSKEYRERLQKEESARREADLRREVDTRSLQSRIERLTADLSMNKEQLAVAKTSVEHLTHRAEDLQKQVNSKEEKLAVYERRSGPAASGTSADPNLSNEQQLQIELAELKGELRSAQVEVEQSKAHVEQYKSIAQATEETLGQLQASYDQYKTSTDASVAAKDSEIAQLRERLESVAAEITTLQNEASAQRQSAETQRREFAAEKRSLEDALAELGSVEEKAKAEQVGVLADVERHAQLAREAHSKYEVELLAHAEDIKALSRVKEELESTRTEAREAQRSYETAQADLSSSRISWDAQREALTREKDAMEQRIKELGEQNNILHTHLETLSAQVSQIRSTAGDTSAANAVDADSSFSAAPSSELQEVVKYLRREKEIANLQMDLNKQEATRLRLNLEHTNRALEETKLQLAEERDRNAQAASGAQQHDDLMEKINQLSILRESNATLRDESEKAQRRAHTLETQLNAANAEIEPLREQVRTLQNELSAAQGQLRIVQEDNQRWQARAQSILAQYDRIDPEEVKRLEEKAANAEIQAKELQQALEASKTELVGSKEQFTKLRNQATERLKALREEVTQLKEQIESLTKERDELQSSAATSQASTAETEGLQQQIAQLDEQRTAAEEAAQNSQQRIQALEAQVAELQSAAAAAAVTAPTTDGSAGSDEAIAKALEDAQKAWQEEKASLEASKVSIENREKLHHQRAREFLTQKRQAEKERDDLRKAMEENEAQLKKQFEESHQDEIQKLVQEKVAAAEGGGAAGASDEALTARAAELEAALTTSNLRIAELEAEIASATTAGGGDGASTSNAGEITQLKEQHAKEMQEQQASLSQQYQKRQTMAVEVAIKKAQSAAASANTGVTAEQVEQQIQERLKASDEAHAAALKSAVEAKEKEVRELLANGTGATAAGTGAADDTALKARYESGFEAGKKEAALRNQLLVKQRDSKIEKLNKEIAELKGEAPPTAAAGTSGAGAGGAAAAATSSQPAVARPAPATVPARGGATAAMRGGRGGAVPVRPTAASVTANAGNQQQQGATVIRGRAVPRGLAIRGGVPGRGGGSIRGAARGGGAVGIGGTGGVSPTNAAATASSVDPSNAASAATNASAGAQPAVSSAFGPAPGAKRKVSEDQAEGGGKKAKGEDGA